jgi:hypothetical protein
MKFCFLILRFAFRLNFFELIPKWQLYFNKKIWKNKPSLYNLYIGFENNAYGLDILVVP